MLVFESVSSLRRHDGQHARPLNNSRDWLCAARIAGRSDRPAIAMLSSRTACRPPPDGEEGRGPQLLRTREATLNGGRCRRHRVRPRHRAPRLVHALKPEANVLIFRTERVNISYHLRTTRRATAISQSSSGCASRSVLERGADVQEIVNMAAVAVIDAQQRTPSATGSETPALGTPAVPGGAPEGERPPGRIAQIISS